MGEFFTIYILGEEIKISSNLGFYYLPFLLCFIQKQGISFSSTV